MNFSVSWKLLAQQIVRSNGEQPLASPIKVGVVAYKKSSNLGDDIQTLAILQNLPSNVVVVPIDREELYAYRSPEPLKCIINGWFMDDATHWPPHPSLEPLFVGFHIANQALLAEKFKSYYMEYSPIGCRDEATLASLRKLGVDGYFSGCPTLCLKRPSNRKRGNTIEVVDAHKISCDWHTGDSRNLLKRIVQDSKNYRYHYSSHRLPFWMGRLQTFMLWLACRKLNCYARLPLIVTNRLHVALPAMAMNTPVLFLHSDPNQSRISSYTKDFLYLNPTMIPYDLGSIEDDGYELPVRFAKMRDEIRSRIREFLSS